MTESTNSHEPSAPLISVEHQYETNVQTGETETRMFFKLYFEAIDSGLLAALGPELSQTLMALSRHIDSDGLCWPTLPCLAKNLGVNRQTAGERMNRLCAARFQAKPVVKFVGKKRLGNGAFKGNVYQVLPTAGVAFGRSSDEVDGDADTRSESQEESREPAGSEVGASMSAGADVASSTSGGADVEASTSGGTDVASSTSGGADVVEFMSAGTDVDTTSAATSMATSSMGPADTNKNQCMNKNTRSVSSKARSRGVGVSPLVEYFHEARGHKGQTPNPKELGQAGVLVRKYGLERARFIVDFAFEEAKRTRFAMEWFGAVLQYEDRGLYAFQEREEDSNRRKATERRNAERTRGDELRADFDRWRLDEVSRIRSGTPPDELQRLEESARDAISKRKGGTPPAGANLLVRLWVDDVLAGVHELASFEEWKKERDCPRERPQDARVHA